MDRRNFLLGSVAVAATGCAKPLRGKDKQPLALSLGTCSDISSVRPDPQGLTFLADSSQPGAGYLLVNTETKDKVSELHIHEYVETPTELTPSFRGRVQFDSDTHVAGLAIANLRGHPHLFWANFMRHDARQGWVRHAPITQILSIASKSGPCATLTGTSIEPFQRASGVAAHNTGQGDLVLVVSRFYGGEPRVRMFEPSRDGQWSSRDSGAKLPLGAQGLEFVGSDFLMSTENGGNNSFITFFAWDSEKQDIGEQLGRIRNPRVQLIEEASVSPGGHLAVASEKLNHPDVVWVRGDKFVDLLVEANLPRVADEVRARRQTLPIAAQP